MLQRGGKRRENMRARRLAGRADRRRVVCRGGKRGRVSHSFRRTFAPFNAERKMFHGKIRVRGDRLFSEKR